MSAKGPWNSFRTGFLEGFRSHWWIGLIIAMIFFTYLIYLPNLLAGMFATLIVSVVILLAAL